jgi:ArsR family metal-binding transcriptional regulator
MLLTDYTLEIFNSKCQPGAMGVHCFAHFKQDVSSALPYLNAVLGGFGYINDPPTLSLRSQGKLITVNGSKAAINALKDEKEASKIVEWLKSEINQAWENRSDITPCFTGKTKPKLMDILRLLPKTNCRKCGQPTCMVFASLLVEGGRSVAHCPELNDFDRTKLSDYLSGFDFE